MTIIHHSDYDASSVSDSHRFPMRKYTLVADLLRERNVSFVEPEHAQQVWLNAVHNPDYVDQVLTSSLSAKRARAVGFEMTPAIAARSRASVGGTVLAGQRALETGRAVNLAGGAHHAGPDGGAGFCVFNDVAVAAQLLLDESRVKKIAILDFDVHHGDGTALCFAEEPRVFTASLHCEDNWPRVKPPSDLDHGLPQGTSDEAYLRAADEMIETVIQTKKPDLVFYNAGVDPHTDDRLGLLDLSDEGLRAREFKVVSACARARVPIASVLGGGYSYDAEAIARRHLFMVEAMLDSA